MNASLRPPEVTSGLIYAGPGAQSLISAALSWSNLAAELEATAAGYQAVISGLGGVWFGPSAIRMAAAAQPYIAWLTNTAGLASQTAAQATQAAEVFYTAFASVVPPPLIAANRVQLAALVATNILGQNTAAIIETEAQYAQMWAQDAAAMITYQAQSAQATAGLRKAQAAPQTATPQAAAAPQVTLPSFESIFGMTFPQWLDETFQSFLSSGPYELPLSLLSLFTVLWGVSAPNSVFGHANAIIEVPANPPYTGPIRASISVGASAGDAGKMNNRLSVPKTWSTPETPKTTNALLPPGTSRQGGDERETTPIGFPAIPAIPLVGVGSTPRRGTDPNSMAYGAPVAPILKRHPSAG